MERLRRLRAHEPMRRLVRETRLSADRFVLPLFVDETLERDEPIAGLSGHRRWPVGLVGAVAKEAAAAGIPAVLVFGVPAAKDPRGSRAFDADGPAQRAAAEIRSAAADLVVMTDVCLCSYTDHGHCGVLDGDDVDNDATIEILGRVAVSHAEAGAHVVAPSDMMDGRVAAIRAALDDAGCSDRAILSYAAKMASAMYGPFRDAAGSAPRRGDRRGYQIDPANRRHALRAIDRDVREGADMIMVKPALTNLDIIREARDRIDVPIAAYNVSGEHAMVTAAAEQGRLDRDAAMLEILTSIARAGADLIVTYHALDAARILEER